MEKLLQDLDAIVDLSEDEAVQMIEVFKEFIHRRFHIETDELDRVFNTETFVVMNRQEDEDDVHAHLGELMYA
ncbi:MAG: hypothetical protein KGZ74_15885 [Chitinophagaceae bacterium]|jgi:hypothetical protein|nr:hypothetical protein [Chitinophagaceae bacterium]